MKLTPSGSVPVEQWTTEGLADAVRHNAIGLSVNAALPYQYRNVLVSILREASSRLSRAADRIKVLEQENRELREYEEWNKELAGQISRAHAALRECHERKCEVESERDSLWDNVQNLHGENAQLQEEIAMLRERAKR